MRERESERVRETAGEADATRERERDIHRERERERETGGVICWREWTDNWGQKQVPMRTHGCAETGTMFVGLAAE